MTKACRDITYPFNAPYSWKMAPSKIAGTMASALLYDTRPQEVMGTVSHTCLM